MWSEVIIVVMIQAKVQRRTLAEQVEEGITDYIISHGLESGHPLPSAARLAEDFGVSRPIVREALKSLEAKGLISVTNGKAATVSPITSDVLRDFFSRVVRQREETFIELLEVRRGIEMQGAMLAAERRTPDDLTTMREILTAMQQHLHNPERYAELDLELHLAIAAASHNSMLYHLLESMRDLVKETVRNGLSFDTTEERRTSVQAQHEWLVQSLESGDAQETERAMANHFERAIKKLIRE